MWRQLLDPNFWLMAIGIALAAFLTGLGMGQKQAQSACELAKAQAQQALQARVDEITAQRQQVAQSREVAREQIRIVYRNLKEQAHEYQETGNGVAFPQSRAAASPISRFPDTSPAADCSLDPDGLRLWNAANAGTDAAVSSEPDYTLSSAAAGQIGAAGRLVAEPHRGDGALRPVPGSTLQISGLHGAVTAPPHPNLLPPFDCAQGTAGEGANEKGD